MANDNLSAMCVAARLAEHLSTLSLRYTYRFLWGPGTIGAITWLARNEALLPKIRHGLVLSCVGDKGAFTYKRTRGGNAEIDRAVEHVLKNSDQNHEVIDFDPLGCDERQFGSPGINLPVGCFMRTPNGKYVENHTSADNLDFVSSTAMAESLHLLIGIVEVLEDNCRLTNLAPKCEPQLGRRGLYRQHGGIKNSRDESAILWVLNLADGKNELLDIAERSGLGFRTVNGAARLLMEHGLLKRGA
jgi:aminopeptidase-like protein